MLAVSLRLSSPATWLRWLCTRGSASVGRHVPEQSRGQHTCTGCKKGCATAAHRSKSVQPHWVMAVAVAVVAVVFRERLRRLVAAREPGAAAPAAVAAVQPAVDAMYPVALLSSCRASPDIVSWRLLAPSAAVGWPVRLSAAVGRPLVPSAEVGRPYVSVTPCKCGVSGADRRWEYGSERADGWADLKSRLKSTAANPGASDLTVSPAPEDAPGWDTSR